MKKTILSALVMILVLSACTPSQSQISTSAAETELASPSKTPLPSLTPSLTPSLIPTETATPTPTPDLRVVDGDPALMLLSAEDLSVVAVYYQSNHNLAQLYKPPYRNSELISAYGEEKAAKYIADSGRIDGRGIVFSTNTNAPDTPQHIISEIVIFATNDGPGVDATGVSPVDVCELSKLADWVSVDIGVDAFACYTELTLIGEWTKDLHILKGVYRNISFQITILGAEASLSDTVAIMLGKLQLEKIMGFPLAPEVTYSP